MTELACGPVQTSGPGWDASLELGFEARCGRTVVAVRRHHGPLAIQRAFYPEGDGTCHAYILHPPGGVVGGDRLSVRASADTGARVLLTTPAATKFYRSAGLSAAQTQHLTVADGAALEWLPQETIVYAGAELALHTRVDLCANAAFIGWDILCLGRPASGERFSRGRVEQRLQLFRAGAPLLLERATYAGDGAEMRAAWGLGGQPVVGALVSVPAQDAASEPRAAAALDALRGLLSELAPRHSACTRIGSALVCRYLGTSVEQAQRVFRASWSVLRRHCMGKSAVEPRIWAT
jgi:urease accessory protein